MTRKLWQDGEMERRLGNPMEGLRGVEFITTNQISLVFPAEDIDALEIYHPTPSYQTPPIPEMKKYFYAKGGAKIRLRPSADQISRFAGGSGHPDVMTCESSSFKFAAIPGSKGWRYWLPFERLMRGPNVVDWGLFYNRPWLCYDGTWDDRVAKCIIVGIPFCNKNRNDGKKIPENTLQTAWIAPEGCLNIIVRPRQKERD